MMSLRLRTCARFYVVHLLYPFLYHCKSLISSKVLFYFQYFVLIELQIQKVLFDLCCVFVNQCAIFKQHFDNLI
eukprot:UN10688